MIISTWTGLKIKLLFDPNRTFAGEVTGGILVDRTYQEAPKKTLEEANGIRSRYRPLHGALYL